MIFSVMRAVLTLSSLLSLLRMDLTRGTQEAYIKLDFACVLLTACVLACAWWQHTGNNSDSSFDGSFVSTVLCQCLSASFLSLKMTSLWHQEVGLLLQTTISWVSAWLFVGRACIHAAKMLCADICVFLYVFNKPQTCLHVWWQMCDDQTLQLTACSPAGNEQWKGDNHKAEKHGPGWWPGNTALPPQDCTVSEMHFHPRTALSVRCTSTPGLHCQWDALPPQDCTVSEMHFHPRTALSVRYTPTPGLHCQSDTLPPLRSLIMIFFTVP